jgi:hypothetical protein
MCNDEAGNVVLYSLNANIHVYVHEDFHKIYLDNVIKKRDLTRDILDLFLSFSILN